VPERAEFQVRGDRDPDRPGAAMKKGPAPGTGFIGSIGSFTVFHRGFDIMLKRVFMALLMVVAVAGLAQTASAQYMYLDANANGVHDTGDKLSANLSPTTVDLYVRTNMNRDGSTAVCDTGPEALTINQYQINLLAVNGTVTYSGFINQQSASMPTNFGEFNPDGIRYKNGYGGGTQLAPGTYRLCTLTITGQTGTPRIDIVDLVSGSADFTGFGSAC